MEQTNTCEPLSTQCKSVLRAQATRIFGPAFPRVEFRTFEHPMRIEVFGVYHRGMELIYQGGRFGLVIANIPGGFLTASPHVFDYGHFQECCQAIRAILGVQVTIHDFLPDSRGAVS